MLARLRLAAVTAAMTALAAAACTSSGLPSSTTTTVLDRTFNVDDVGLYINCAAPESEPLGTHTIILLHGSGERAHSGIWTKVQPRLAQEVLTCRYDRLGMRESGGLPSTGPRSGSDLVATLRELLDVAGIDGPYIVVGHSFGGFTAILFAAEYPADTAGIMLVDSPHEDMMDDVPVAPENIDKQALKQELETASDLAGIPLVVLARGKDLTERWERFQSQLAERSSRSLSLTAEGSGHQIPVEQPKAIVAAYNTLLGLMADAD